MWCSTENLHSPPVGLKSDCKKFIVYSVMKNSSCDASEIMSVTMHSNGRKVLQLFKKKLFMQHNPLLLCS